MAIGLLAVDSVATLTDVGVYDTLPNARGDFGRGIDSGVGASRDRYGSGVQTEAGAVLTMTRGTVVGNTEGGRHTPTRRRV